jgi:hypothetical protein
VRRIEGAAEQPDAHAARIRRQDDPTASAGSDDRKARRKELAVHGLWKEIPPHAPPAGSAAARRGLAGDLSWPRLPAAMYAVFESRQLLDADRAPRVQPASRDADLGAEAELAAIGELRRGIVQNDRRIDFA